jgi:hypothetical protein
MESSCLQIIYQLSTLLIKLYLAILGGSLKNTAKNITINVPVNKNTYTRASIYNLLSEVSRTF